jgi:hypothetical protein
MRTFVEVAHGARESKSPVKKKKRDRLEGKGGGEVETDIEQRKKKRQAHTM